MQIKMRPMSIHKLRASISAASVIAATYVSASPAFAQEDTEDAASIPVNAALGTASLEPKVEDGKQIYDAAVFTRFAPQTASDMVAQIPGFTISRPSQDRGLGEASQNVIINGQRISGKSNDARTVLGRTPAASVVRIEIVDGASLNIPGLSGQVLNLVTKSTGIQGNFSWRSQFRRRIQPHLTHGEINVSGKLGKGDFTLGLNNTDSFRGGGWGEEIATDGNGDLLFVRDRLNKFYGDRPKLAGTYTRTSAAGSIFNLNAEFGLNRFRRRQERQLSGPQNDVDEELSTGQENEWNAEVSADYEFALAGGRLKLVGFHRSEHSPFENLFRQDFLDNSPAEASQFNRVADEGESIARAEYSWKGGKSDWQISAEGAFNFLDVESELFELDNMGVFQPEALDNASSRVSEKRGQVILSYGRPLAPNLTLQAQLGGEYSQIKQTGANGLTRQFIRPKGQVSLAWKASPRLDVSAKIQRKVGQLNFFDFISSVDLQDDNNNAGNPELVPPQSWLAELEFNRSLGAAGSINLKLQYERFSDIVDQIPIGIDGEAPGNLPDSADRYSAEANVTFLLDSIGFKGAKLDLEGYYQKSSLTDPVTGLRRRFGDDRRWTWEVDFRHDIPGSNLAWGFGAEDRSQAPFLRLNFSFRPFATKPQTFAFIEHKNILGLKLRAQIINLLGQQEKYQEIFYTDRLNNVVDQVRDGTNNFGQIFRFTVSGTF